MRQTVSLENIDSSDTTFSSSHAARLVQELLSVRLLCTQNQSLTLVFISFFVKMGFLNKNGLNRLCYLSVFNNITLSIFVVVVLYLILLLMHLPQESKVMEQMQSGA